MLRSLTPEQKREAKGLVSKLIGLSHPHICQVSQVTETYGNLTVECEPLVSSMKLSNEVNSHGLEDADLARQFLGIVAGLEKAQLRVRFRRR